ncbi:MAG: TlpA disulfide reductase family protein [Anaerolineae bacterium]|nr:MAG: TlpA disulfide reductase family protein [Anaerolineae bacterium]
MADPEEEAIAKVDRGGTAKPTGRRWVTIVVWGGLLGMLGLLGFGLVRAQQGPVGVGAEAPEFTLNTFDGGQVNTADLIGKVLVVNFWASWCKPCEQEAPELEMAHRMYKSEGVVFVGLDYLDTEAEALAYLDRFDITYPNGPDLGSLVSQAYRMRGIPETFIVGPDGRIAAVQIGPYSSLDEIAAHIEQAKAQ